MFVGPGRPFMVRRPCPLTRATQAGRQCSTKCSVTRIHSFVRRSSIRIYSPAASHGHGHGASAALPSHALRTPGPASPRACLHVLWLCLPVTRAFLSSLVTPSAQLPQSLRSVGPTQVCSTRLGPGRPCARPDPSHESARVDPSRPNLVRVITRVMTLATFAPGGR